MLKLQFSLISQLLGVILDILDNLNIIRLIEYRNILDTIKDIGNIQTSRIIHILYIIWNNIVLF